jgi:hypothetical protein
MPQMEMPTSFHVYTCPLLRSPLDRARLSHRLPVGISQQARS